jgi:hypothetical protein
MKKRAGFVSNSSSSSFVVAFPKTPANVAEVRDIMYGHLKSVSDPEDLDTSHDTWRVAEIVFGDIERHEEPLSPQEIRTEIASGHFDGCPDYAWPTKDETQAERNARWEREDRRRKEAAEKLAGEFLADNDTCVFYRFHYSDNDGEFMSFMEHGNIFRALEHIKIGYH